MQFIRLAEKMQQKYILIKKPVLDSLCKKRYPLGRQSTRALCEATFGTREVLDMAILVSGGAGYIGSHTCIELLNAGYDVVVADNYYNASPVVLDRVKQITGKDFRFYQADMTKHEDVEKIFAECPDITAVIQFAAYKAVGESVSKPIEYYYNNLNCTLVILDVMRKHNCHNFVFSSSATVYGDPASVPITEDFPVGATTNPYGTTKAFTERILTDVCKADPTLNVALLRYFNPIGAHKSGLIGEDPNGIPNNLMPYIAKVAVGKLEKVHVFGNDYPTPDGTGVRDYIHVVDLARGHVCAIKKLETEVGLADIISVFSDLLKWVRTYDSTQAKEITPLLDAFVKSKLS